MPTFIRSKLFTTDFSAPLDKTWYRETNSLFSIEDAFKYAKHVISTAAVIKKLTRINRKTHILALVGFSFHCFDSIVVFI